MISIVDYGMGNLRSVEKALQRLGFETTLVNTRAQIDQAARLILPGVGAFGDAMKGLAERSLVEPLRDYAASGRPLFGICLGMQILFEDSEEDPGVEGLGLLKGTVKKFVLNGLKVPHMGWNQLRVVSDSPWFQDLGDKPYVYFVHSYYVMPKDATVTAALTEYGIPFTAAVASGSIGGTQFHPEKSQEIGLRILKNFAGVPALVE
jgi:imidazole glycerol-phosphate synthase subunit HisH